MIEVKNILGKPRKRQGVVIPPAPLYLDTIYNADIVPGKSIRLHGIHQKTPFDVFFEVGGEAEYDSYNLHYTGIIVAITEKTITIQERDGTNHRLDLYTFAWRNYDFNAEKIAAHNLTESHSI